jgi:cell division protein ZapA
MSSKNVTVTIMAREFIIACPEGQEKSLLDSVQYLNQKIDLIQSQGSIVGIDRIIIMAALNITNELLNQNSADGLDISQFRHKISSIEHQIDEVLAQN